MANLKRLLAEGSPVLAPGVYDCVGAKLAAAAGFKAVAISGYGAEASLYGLPDLGFTGLADISGLAARIASAIDVPVICDADTGYGGPAQVWDCVRRLERTGVQAIHIEDQASPKKCGGLPGRAVIPVEEMCAKIKAATMARHSSDFLVIARTDVKSAEGVVEAARRLNAYFDSGADLGFAAENYTIDELRELSELTNGPLAICGGVPGWSGSFESGETYASMGIRLIIYPFSSLFVAAKAMRDFYGLMQEQGRVTPQAADEHMCSFDWFSDFIGVGRWSERESAAASGRYQTEQRSKE